jgi:hypothetical protein
MNLEDGVTRLRWHWGDAYEITQAAGTFRASRRDDGSVLTADAARCLSAKIHADYLARPVPRGTHPDHFLAGGKLTALVRDFPAWEIDRFSTRPPTWVAVLRRGTFTHVLAAHDLDDLRAKLEKATAEVR